MLEKYKPVPMLDNRYALYLLNPSDLLKDVLVKIQICVNGTPVLRSPRLVQSLLIAMPDNSDKEYIAIVKLQDRDGLHIITRLANGIEWNYWAIQEAGELIEYDMDEYKTIRKGGKVRP